MPPVATDEEVAAAEAAVAKQGAAVRALKAEGRGNSDECVQASVAQLLAQKAVLAGMVAAREAALAKDANIAAANESADAVLVAAAEAAMAEEPDDFDEIEACSKEDEAGVAEGTGDNVIPRQ